MVEDVLEQISRIKQLSFRVAIPAFILILIGINIAVFYYFNDNKHNKPIANKVNPIKITPKIKENSQLPNKETDIDKKNHKIEDDSKVAKNNSNNNYNNIKDLSKKNHSELNSTGKNFPREGSRSGIPKVQKLPVKNIILESVRSFYIKELEQKIGSEQNWYLDFFDELKSKTKDYWVIEDSKYQVDKTDVAFSIDDKNNIILKDKKKNILWVSNIKLGVGDAKEAASAIVIELSKVIKTTTSTTNIADKPTNIDK